MDRTCETHDPDEMTDFMAGTCEWCGDENVSIFRDTNLCEECDSDTIHCAICDERRDRHDTCRHVFETRDFEWAGSGVGVPTGYQLDHIRGALLRLLSLMPEGFAADLKTAIRSGRFHTWAVMPIIGGGGILSLYGMPDRDGKDMLHAWGDALLEIGGGEHAEETADGYHWLASLYDRETRAANRLTIRWIDEFTTRHGTGKGGDNAD